MPASDFAVIGTAGHVDHGKTTLVQALTGVDTDRLPEEKRRGISIDIGFAALTLPSGRHAAIVDVPGHERFIKNMVAGASGIDCCLLVVAADEGVMPQTREHLDIVGLLGVRRGVVALTKADTVEPDWLDLVREELGEEFAGTFLADAPVVVCDAVSGRGVAEVAAALDRLLAGLPGRTTAGHMRMPIDRVFTVPGFGTVVTGTLVAGAVAVEDRLELMPGRLAVRVRGLQVHGRPVPAAAAGQRTAINLAGVDHDEVHRGDVLATPATLTAAKVFAARLRLLPRGEVSLDSGDRAHLHVGTAETVARIVLLERDTLAPGEEDFALLYPQLPLAVAPGDRFVIRRISPVTTIGGGTVLEVGRRFRRFEPKGLAHLEVRERGDPKQVTRAAVAAQLPTALGEVSRSVGVPVEEVAQHLRDLQAEGAVIGLPGGAWQEAGAYRALARRAADALAAYHHRYSLRSGMPREELRATLWPSLDPRTSNELLDRLQADGHLSVSGDRVAASGWKVTPPPALAAAAARLTALLAAAGIEPPALPEALASTRVPTDAAEEILRHLSETGQIVRVADDLAFARNELDGAVDRVRAHLTEVGTATLAELRDLLGTTRKYAVPLAEWMDRVHITRRQGDVRRLA